MKTTTRKPTSVGEMLHHEFLDPMNIEHAVLADAMGVHRNTISRLVNDKGRLSSEMAIRLAAALGTTPAFWLKLQHAMEMWEVAEASTDPEKLGVKPLNLTTSSF